MSIQSTDVSYVCIKGDTGLPGPPGPPGPAIPTFGSDDETIASPQIGKIYCVLNLLIHAYKYLFYLFYFLLYLIKNQFKVNSKKYTFIFPIENLALVTTNFRATNKTQYLNYEKKKNNVNGININIVKIQVLGQI